MESITQNELSPITVGSLLKQKDNKPIYNFYIPSYQRGYRWNIDQIEDLLQDLYDFIFSPNTEYKYCLQPIVVKKMKDGRYEVLDGQQRLTTIYIIINCLKKYLPELKSFSLTYDTREHSEKFLKKIQTNIDDSNPDYFYISQAYIIIDKWIKEKKEQHASIASKFEIAFDDSIEFIWYEIIEKTDAIDVFTRINIGKIPLTNSETGFGLTINVPIPTDLYSSGKFAYDIYKASILEENLKEGFNTTDKFMLYLEDYNNKIISWINQTVFLVNNFREIQKGFSEKFSKISFDNNMN